MGGVKKVFKKLGKSIGFGGGNKTPKVC